METTLSYVTLALAAATLLVTLYLAIRLKSVHYLLQQPVVKKMSPQLRLKPVKLDEALDRNRNRDRGPGGPGGRDGRGEGRRDDRRPERPEGPRERGEDRNRDGRDRDGRDRRDGRPDRGEGRPERAEGDRGRDRDRNRDGRDRRDGRPERGNDRRPPREFSETRDFAPPPQPEYPAPAAEAPASLPARRPLPSFADAPAARADVAAPSAPSRENSASGTFAGSGDDMQHGRRTQLKKKPRFDFDEEETPAA